MTEWQKELAKRCAMMGCAGMLTLEEFENIVGVTLEEVSEIEKCRSKEDKRRTKR